MTPAEFKVKWHRYTGKESSAYQSHFNDLCDLLQQPTPALADPSGSEFFCFQKRVVKDAELFALDEDGSEAADTEERGFADVWKKGCFAWEYKGKKKNLDEAYKQLLRYRESLLNPPLLVVCDFDRYIIRTNFNGTVQDVHEFTNDQIDRPENLRILRAVFTDPEFLRPQKTTAQVTENLASHIAQVARSLQSRESVELADAKNRREHHVAQKKNLRIARFLNRIIFCFFAEDTGLLPAGLFTEVTKTGLEDPRLFAESLEELFRVMAKGGRFGSKAIRHFNGHLFEDSSVFELTEDEIRSLAEAGEADWQFIQPSIMGTLFERALDEGQRSQLGAHYTSETDIRTLVEPVLMDPLRREWAEIKRGLLGAYQKGKGSAADRAKLAAFLNKLSAITVLDPACGSGNFLYVSLQLLLGLEKEVIAFATQLGFSFKPQVTVQQLKAIEINPYAFELAQVSVQIGYLQWRRDNGFDNDRSPVLQNLDGFLNEDALLVPHYHSKAKNLKEAQASEHAEETALKFYSEREWPKCDVIVGNPPFLGARKLKEELGEGYQQELWRIYAVRVPGFADLCCYWFAKAREQVEEGVCVRAGLLATQAIRGGANREVLEEIKRKGDIFFAVGNRPWILDGADVGVSLIGFDDGSEKAKTLDGRTVENITANLSASCDLTRARLLASNSKVCFQGSQKIGPFEVDEATAFEWLRSPNVHGKPNSDVIRPTLNGADVARRPRCQWTVDFGTDRTEEEAAKYAQPFTYVSQVVRPEREKNHREAYRRYWWRHGEPRVAMRAAIARLPKYLATPEVAKYRLFTWIDSVFLPDKKLMVFAVPSDWTFGVLQARIHEVWTNITCNLHAGERRTYNPTECFAPFPFPVESPAVGPAVAAAAKELNDLRERWLNPPEWTVEKVLEFPGSASGPWARYVHNPDPHGIGTVRYPRLEPRDPECAAKLKKRTLTNLYNERPAWLDLAHKKLDAAVAAAYGWPADLTDDQILERLLPLNLERAAEEEKAGRVSKPKGSREKREDEII